MAKQNMIQRVVDRVNHAPGLLRTRVLTTIVRTLVPYVGTSQVRIEELTRERVVTSIPNRRRVQNHIGGVHATAMALLAETATGFVVAMNLPEDKLPLIKTLAVNYRRRTKGAMRAVATLTEEQRQRMRAEDKGDFPVSVIVTDESNEPPIECELIWAWVPKRR